MIIQLTKGQVAIIDDADLPLIGKYKWQAMWCKSTDTYYAKQTYIDENGRKRSRFMHRVILGVSDRTVQVDHENHDGLDNQRTNIRIATPSQNMANTRGKRQKKSPGKGIWFDSRRRKWVAQLTVNYKPVYIGRFLTQEEAQQAYNAAAEQAFGEFCNLPLETHNESGYIGSSAIGAGNPSQQKLAV